MFTDFNFRFLIDGTVLTQEIQVTKEVKKKKKLQFLLKKKSWLAVHKLHKSHLQLPYARYILTDMTKLYS